MPSTNLYFNNFEFSQEQNLIEDLIIESIKIYGIECYYLPRTLVREDELFGEDALAKFDIAFPIEMYIKSIDGFQGDGDFLSKFGLEIRDSMVLTIAQRRFEDEVHITETTPFNEEEGIGRPSEGDLVYFPLNGKIFEVKFVEHEAIFYQMGKLQTYDLTLELFEYSHESIDTGIAEIDAIETEHSTEFIFISLEGALPFATAVATVTGQFVTSTSVTFGGLYETAEFVPRVTFSDPPPSITAVPEISIVNGSISSITFSNVGRGYVTPTLATIEGRQAIDGWAVSESKFGDYSYKLGTKETDTLFTRHEDVSEGYFNFHLYVPSGSNTVYGKVFTIEDTEPDWIINVANTANSTYSLELQSDGTLYANNVAKDAWNFFSVKVEDDSGNQRITLFKDATQVATSITGTQPSNLFKRIVNVNNTRSGNVYIDHLFIDTDLSSVLSYTNTAVSNSGTITTLLTFENSPPTDPFTVFANNVTIDANGSINAIAIPVVSGGEIVSANITMQDAPTSFPAQATATVTNNEVVLLTITNQGQGYVDAPTITIQSDSAGGRIKLEDNIYLIDDGIRYANTDPQANNTLFENDTTSFIDFSEFNPFSEGDRW